MTEKNRPVETLRATSPSHYNGYLIPSSRLKEWDYSASGLYFVTICTQERHPHFGAVADGELYLSHAGVIVGLLWCSIPDHYPRAACGEFVVMPNHVHGVLGLVGRNEDDAGSRGGGDADVACNVSTAMSRISPRAGSLGAVVRSYKAAVTRWCHANGQGHFRWQPRYHDRVIRSEASLRQIERYIADNPARWQTDEYHL